MGPRALALNRPDETPQEERKIRERYVQASRKRLEDGRVAEEALTQTEIGGEAGLAGVLQKKAMSGPGPPRLDSEG